MLRIIVFLFLLSTLNLISNSRFSSDRIQDACLQFLESKISAKIKVDFLNQITDLEFIEDDVEAYFELNGPEIGISSIKIYFMRESADIRRVSVPIKIYQIQNVAIANQNLKIGDEFSNNNIRFETRAIDYKYNIDTKTLFGSVSKRAIKAGDILNQDFIEYPSIIEKGDEILVNVETASVSITTKGKALNDAKIGQEVSIQRDGSKKIITGIATADGSVIVKK